jgi:hypothetical protein
MSDHAAVGRDVGAAERIEDPGMQTADKDSSAALEVSSAYSTGGASTWMSMRSSNGPDTRCR